MTKKKRGKNIIIALGIFVLLLVSALAILAIYTLNYDYLNFNFMENKGAKLGFVEHSYTLADGSVLNYAEGPDNGPPLFLIHGQQVDWQTYAKVYPQLSQHFHIFAVDCYGHGKSTKDPALYTAKRLVTDFALLIEDKINEPVIVSGHSSGALLTALLAAESSELVSGIILEDGPFFSTEPERAPETFAGLDFEVIHNFLNQTDETNYTRYSLQHNYMKNLFNADGNDNWNNIVVKPALNYMDKHGEVIPIIWYYPPKLGINSIYALTANLQDGTSNYDLRFGETFYNYSWFEDFDQATTLSQIKCPAFVMHVAPDKETGSYYDDNGILLAAMDDKDADRVTELIPNATLYSGFESMHDIHGDQPDEFIQVLLDMKNLLEED